MESVLGVSLSALWFVVTPATITQEVPEYYYSADSAGSVQVKEKLAEKPAVVCQIIENGKVVGFSMRKDCE